MIVDEKADRNYFLHMIAQLSISKDIKIEKQTLYGSKTNLKKKMERAHFAEQVL